MLRLDVLQSQWIVAAIMGGIVLALVTALAYLTFWQPRRRADAEETSASGRMPLVLVLTYVVMALFIVAYTAFLAFRPPNW